MAIIQHPLIPANLQHVTSKNAALVSLVQLGHAYAVASNTNTISAALGANSCLFAMRLDPSAGSITARIERIRVSYTCLVAFTVPLTAGRRLALYRGSGAATTGGAAIATVAKKDSTSPASEFENAQGGDVRIATTGALGVTGVTFEANEFAQMPLAHLGAAGNFMEQVFEFSASESAPIILQPGQLIAIRNPQAMDAAGTWQMAVRVDWHEINSTTL
jgi:hypothetical protein